MKVTRRLEWDSGHRVLGHEGKCKHLHGHRYVAEVTVEAQSLDRIGRVVDFSVLKTEVGGWIDSVWDHNTLLNKDDPLVDAIDWREVNGKLPYVMVGNPTAENMVEELIKVAQSLMAPYGIEVVHIRIYETPNCWADCNAREFPGSEKA